MHLEATRGLESYVYILDGSVVCVRLLSPYAVREWSTRDFSMGLNVLEESCRGIWLLCPCVLREGSILGTRMGSNLLEESCWGVRLSRFDRESSVTFGLLEKSSWGMRLPFPVWESLAIFGLLEGREVEQFSFRLLECLRDVGIRRSDMMSCLWWYLCDKRLKIILFWFRERWKG